MTTYPDHTTMAPDPLNVALEHHRRGELASAESGYRAILAVQPRHPGALMGLGMIAHQSSDPGMALALLEEARRAAPRDPAILNNLGLVLAAAGRDEEAQAIWRRALTIAPGLAEALVNLANAAVREGRFEDAIMRLRAATAADSRCCPAAANLGELLLGRRRYSEALQHLRRAALLEPRNADVRVNIGRALSECGLAPEARAAFESAVRLRPGDAAAESNLLLSLHYCDDLDSEAVANAHRAWGAGVESATRTAPRPPVVPERRRMRVGLLSGDFNDHSVMRFLAPVLAHRDPARTEFFCYYTRTREDAYTQFARNSSDAFRWLGQMSDDTLAAQVRNDELDVLIDLSGHSAGGRPRVLASRLAPLQVSWLGYLSTTGLAAIDFRLTDRMTDPPDFVAGPLAERLWYLPAMWCYQPRPDSPAVSSPPFSTTGCVTFGSTNNPAKLSDTALSLWARVISEVPGSRMMVHAHDDPLCRNRISNAFAARGITPDRIHYFEREPASGYLARYAAIDVLLDSTPYSGGATTCDALWMGVPVVTLAGDRPFSRTSASVLQAAGYPQWIACDRESYIGLAVGLAADLPALAAFRERLRHRMAQSRLCDGQAMADDLASALESMWSSAGFPPRGPFAPPTTPASTPAARNPDLPAGR